ncbi:MAG: AzlD domain-containing protein [Dethiobacter sp.]|nr:AzlD domain-containing protein [Dethiobacter sp.]
MSTSSSRTGIFLKLCRGDMLMLWAEMLGGAKKALSIVLGYLPRFLPLYVLTRLEIPQIVIVAWFRYIPVSVLAALVMPGILLTDRQIFLSVSNSYLLATVPAFLVAWPTKNMLLTISMGMGTVLILQLYPLA